MENKKRGAKSRGLDKAFLMMMTKDMYEAVSEAAAAEGKSMAQWVREAITDKAGKQPWKDVETRSDVHLREALQRWHNRGDRG